MISGKYPQNIKNSHNKTPNNPIKWAKDLNRCFYKDEYFVYLLKFTGRVDAEVPILWPPHAKSQLIRKDSDTGKD